MESDQARAAPSFVANLDSAIDAHTDWTRRILRHAILRTRPGDDVMRAEAHRRCRFGIWFDREREAFLALDAQKTSRLDRVHRDIHVAIQRICDSIGTSEPGTEGDLDHFDASRSEFISILSAFRTLALRAAARHDPLADLSMRRGIERELSLCQRDATRRGEFLYLAKIGVDNLRLIRDAYGQEAGDAVLGKTHNVLKNAVRSHEPLYRVGNEEFLLMLRASSPAGARAGLRRLLDAIRGMPVDVHGTQVNVTATIGAARVEGNVEIDAMNAAADNLLAQGRRAGSDRAIFAGDIKETP